VTCRLWSEEALRINRVNGAAALHTPGGRHKRDDALEQILREVADEEGDQRAQEEEKKRQELEHELVKLDEEELQK
jgi:hypothetical protein